MEFLKILNIMGEHLFKSKHTGFYSHTGHEIIDANVYIILLIEIYFLHFYNQNLILI
jgi:hypothetical protein